MVFSPDPGEEAVRDRARLAGDRIVAPGAEARDRDAVFPGAEIRELAGQGWLGRRAAPEVGGRGDTPMGALLAVREFSRACASIGLLVGIHNFIVIEGIAEHGSEEARRRFLRPLASGQLL